MGGTEVIPDLTLLDQREPTPGRHRSLMRLVDQGERRWYVADVDRIVDCGRNWSRATELFRATTMDPAMDEPLAQRGGTGGPDV